MSLQQFAQSAAQAFKGGATHISKGLGVMGGIMADKAGVVANKAREAARVVGDAAVVAASHIPAALDIPMGAGAQRGGGGRPRG